MTRTHRTTSMDDARRVTPLEVTSRSSPAGTQVTVTGELDLATAERFDAALRDALAASGTVTLDLSGLTFLDSAGLRALDATHREALRTGAAFTVAPALGPAVRRALELSGLLGVLPVSPTATG